MRTADGSEAQKPIQTRVIRRKIVCSHVSSYVFAAAGQLDENESRREVWTNRQVGPA